MPIYEYYCSECSHELSKLQKISDKPLKTCPACGKNTLTKKISGAGFVLKGSGWYVTDFKNKPAGKASQATDGAADKAADKPAAKESSDAAKPIGAAKPARPPATAKDSSKAAASANGSS